MSTLRSRRRLLSTIAAGSLSAALAGCTSFESPPPGVAIEDISFSNFSPDNQTIEYQVERADEIVVDRSVTLRAETIDSNDDGEEDLHYANKIVEHEKLYERAVYTIRVRLAGDDEWRLEFTFDGESYTCLGLSVDVSERESMAVLSGEIPASRCSALTTTTSE